MSPEEKINCKLQEIKGIFDVEKLLNFKLDDEYVKRYYLINELAYTFFHSRKGFIHFAVCQGEQYAEDGLLYQPLKVLEYIRNRNNGKALELACGRGANLEYLAGLLSQIDFFGIDLSPTQLSCARKKVKRIKNIIAVEEGDFHDLSRYENDQFEAVFIFEALCYSTRKKKVFAEVKRIVKPGGFFVVADAYWRKKNLEKKSNEYVVKRLLEIGMALNKYECYEDVLGYALKTGWRVIEEDDVTRGLAANCVKFERLAKRFIGKKWMAVLLKNILPKKFLYNVFLGYLGGDCLRAGWGRYVLTVWQK